MLLWLFVVFSGIAAGAGLYETRIVVPRWFVRTAEVGPRGIRVDAEAMRTLDPGRRFWAFVTTGPLTLLTLASLGVAWRSAAPGHDWWLAAAAVTLVERVMTLAYFIPRALRLMRAETLPPEQAGAMASRWMGLNHLRVALSLAGWLLALRAVSLRG
ncbi:MAG TPA: anthrone oxygenase family protein [Gemmatimonadales bacterium]|nr:anthrone oxygenase family protein [Gemmatimonadales bacterium]